MALTRQCLLSNTVVCYIPMLGQRDVRSEDGLAAHEPIYERLGNDQPWAVDSIGDQNIPCLLRILMQITVKLTFSRS